MSKVVVPLRWNATAAYARPLPEQAASYVLPARVHAERQTAWQC